MDAFIAVAGAAIVLVALLDIFFTVLFPASRHGPIRKPLSAAVWAVFRLMGRATGGQTRRNLLSYGGPVLIGTTMIGWFVLLATGFAMLVKPALGIEIIAASGPTDTGWTTALYYSGFTLTTLGIGDLAPETSKYRLLTVAEGAVGFAYFSMAITYFLSVYSNLTGRNAFAQGLHHLTGKTGDAAELIARLAEGNDLERALRQLGSKADFLRQIQQSHAFYPVLRYFHYRESYYALPRILLIAFDAAALLRCAPGGKLRTALRRSPDLAGLEYAAADLLEALGMADSEGPPAADQEAAWRQRFEQAVALFELAGLEVREDVQEAADEYVSRRAKWDRALRGTADAMLYDWEEIDSPMPAARPQPAPAGT